MSDKPKRYLGLGHVHLINNSEKKFGADDQYLHVRVSFPSGACEEDWLLTWEQRNIVRDRAAKNPEDLPKPGSLWHRFLAWMGR